MIFPEGFFGFFQHQDLLSQFDVILGQILLHLLAEAGEEIRADEYDCKCNAEPDEKSGRINDSSES